MNSPFVEEVPKTCQLFGIGHEFGHLMSDALHDSVPELSGPGLAPGKNEILADIMGVRAVHKLGGISLAEISSAIGGCEAQVFGPKWDSFPHPPMEYRTAHIQNYCEKRIAQHKHSASAESWDLTLLQIIAESNDAFTEQDMKDLLEQVPITSGVGEEAMAFINLKCTGPKGCEAHASDVDCSGHETRGKKLCSWMTVCNKNPHFCHGT